MAYFSKEQKKEFNRLQNLLINANTSLEVQYYSIEIHELIAKAKIENQKINSPFNEEQLKLYTKYKEKMLKSRYPKGVRCYGVKLHQLIDEVLDQGAYDKQLNLSNAQIAAYYEYKYGIKSNFLVRAYHRKKIKDIIPEEILSKISL